MKRILTSIVVSFWFSSYAQTNIPCLSADIILLVDMSNSMSGTENIVSDAVSTLVEGIPVEEHKIQFALVTFSDTAKIEIPLTSDFEFLLRRVSDHKNALARGSTTRIIPGISRSIEILRGSDNKYDHLQIIVVISDGDIAEKETIGKYLEVLHQKENITFFSLGYGQEKDISDFFEVVSRTKVTIMDVDDFILEKISGKENYFRNDSKSLRDAIRKLGACL